MRRRSAMTLGLLFAGLGVLGLSHEAVGQGGGMVLLSDGTNIQNFDQAGNANWRVGERTIYADRGVGFLVTKQSYGDFRLRAEVWVDDIANSGIFIRCDDPEEPGAASCYEVNIWDTRPDPTYGTGAIVNVAKSSDAQSRPQVERDGDRGQGSAAHRELNGKQTVSVQDGKHARGRIAFQYGQGVVRWRKIEIQPL